MLSYVTSKSTNKSELIEMMGFYMRLSTCRDTTVLYQSLRNSGTVCKASFFSHPNLPCLLGFSKASIPFS